MQLLGAMVLFLLLTPDVSKAVQDCQNSKPETQQIGDVYEFYCPNSDMGSSNFYHRDHSSGQLVLIFQGARMYQRIQSYADAGQYCCAATDNTTAAEKCCNEVVVPAKVSFSTPDGTCGDEMVAITCTATSYPMPNLRVQIEPTVNYSTSNPTAVDTYTQQLQVNVPKRNITIMCYGDDFQSTFPFIAPNTDKKCNEENSTTAVDGIDDRHSGTDEDNKTIRIIIIAIVAALIGAIIVVLVLLVVGMCLCRRRRSKRKNENVENPPHKTAKTIIQPETQV